MKRLAVLSAVLVLSISAGPVGAQTGGMKGMDMKGMDMKDMDKDQKGMAKKSQAKTHHAVGVVKSVDADKGAVTVDHEAVSSMNWPAMTMSFKAHDKRMLQPLKPGSKIEFDFVNRGKDHVITKIK